MTAPQDDIGPTAESPVPAEAGDVRENTLLHWIIFVVMMSAIIGAGYLVMP